MICVTEVRKYCKDFERIENYEKAIADTTQTWECHHILGEVFTRKQLIAGNNYFDVEPECLIFLTNAEHNSLHKKGFRHTEDTKRKISKTLDGHSNYNKGGYKLSEETKRKMSEYAKNRPRRTWKLIDGKRVYGKL